MNTTTHATRVARAGLALGALIAIATGVMACADKEFTPPKAALSPRMTLQLTATGLASQVGPSPLYLLVGALYMSAEQNQDGEPERILAIKFARITQNTQQVALPVDIAPCLADGTRLGTKDGCTMYLAAAIVRDSFDFATDTADRDPLMTANDYVFLGPYDVAPGRAPTIPPIDLALSRFGVIEWQQDEALRLGGTVQPNAMTGVLGLPAPLAGVPSGTGIPVLFALTRGNDFPIPSNNGPLNFQTYPQIQILQNGSWRRVTANSAPSNSGFNDVTAFAANEAYISGNAGLFRFDGTAITRVPQITDTLFSVASTTVGTVRYVITGGNGGAVWIGNTTTWQRYTVGTPARIDGVCITGPNEAFASVSNGGSLFRFNGTTWTSVPAIVTGGKLDLQCPAPGQAFVLTVGGLPFRWTGTGWTQMSTSGIGPGRVLRWGVASANEIFAYADSGQTDRAFYRYDGTAWQEIGRRRYVQNSGRPWADPRGGAAYLLSSSGRIERITPSATSVLSYLPALRDASMTSPTSAFVVGGNNFLARWNGTQWTVDTPPAGTPSTRILHGVWSDGPNNAWAVGNASTIFRYDGTAWRVVSDVNRPITGSADGYNAVWGIGSDVWIAGDAGITHCRSTTLCSLEHAVTGVYGIWGSSASSVFAVGSGGKILRYNGTSWTSMTSPTSRFLARVSGSSATDVWALGDSVLVRYDGTTWTQVPLSGEAAPLRSRAPSPLQNLFQLGLWVRGPKEVYIGGDNGQIARWNGAEWREAFFGGYYLRRVIAIAGAPGGCAIALTEGQTESLHPTLWRGIGPSGCLSTPMAPPSSWP